MKKDIHPDYQKTTIKCVCGNEIETGSVEENITVEIASHRKSDSGKIIGINPYIKRPINVKTGIILIVLCILKCF